MLSTSSNDLIKKQQNEESNSKLKSGYSVYLFLGIGLSYYKEGCNMCSMTESKCSKPKREYLRDQNTFLSEFKVLS
jgi:hypothetical protein